MEKRGETSLASFFRTRKVIGLSCRELSIPLLLKRLKQAGRGGGRRDEERERGRKKEEQKLAGISRDL